jgi:hypothetical protein
VTTCLFADRVVVDTERTRVVRCRTARAGQQSLVCARADVLCAHVHTHRYVPSTRLLCIAASAVAAYDATQTYATPMFSERVVAGQADLIGAPGVGVNVSSLTQYACE